MSTEPSYTAFSGHKLIIHGDLRATVLALKARWDENSSDPILVFDDRTGRSIDFDLRGTAEDALARLADHPALPKEDAPSPARSGPGRPKLGVISREVSLLPRHWEWLEQQQGGISVTLRKLVEEAKKKGQGKQLGKQAREAAGNFMWAMAGNLPNFEEASRALYAKDEAQLERLIKRWPADIRRHVAQLVAEAVRLETGRVGR